MNKHQKVFNYKSGTHHFSSLSPPNSISCVVPFEILHSEGPFEVASFEHFGLEWHFSMAAMIVFTPKCPLEGNISRLERTECETYKNGFKKHMTP